MRSRSHRLARRPPAGRGRDPRADRRRGGRTTDFGLSWLVQRAPRARARRLLAQRGRGRAVRLRRQCVLPVRGGEKMSAPFRVSRARPQRPCVDAGDRRQRARQGGTAHRGARPASSRRSSSSRRSRAFLELVLGELPPLDVALERAQALHPLAAELVEPLLSFTLAPTLIEASKQRNVIPATCVVTVDCRLFRRARRPRDAGSARARRTRAGRLRARMVSSGTAARGRRWRRRSGRRSRAGSTRSSPARGSRRSSVRLHRLALDARGVRNRRLRLLPAQKTMDGELAARLVHSADERIPVDDLELGVHALRAAATSLGSP